MEFSIFTLKNGLQVIHQELNGPASHCGFLINVGSRDEQDAEHGMVHFIEHCIFKGSRKRKAYHILSRLDAVGGEINAYTTKEDTMIHASFLNTHFERALELLTDITFFPSFPDKEISKEKLIVIDEIKAYLDSPGEQIFDDFEDLLFQGHPIGHNILGTSEQLKKFKSNHLKAFHSKYYHPQNIVFSVVGNIPLKTVKRLCEKYLSELPLLGEIPKRKVFKLYAPQNTVKERDVNQAHLLMGNMAYSMNDEERRPMILLNNILGGPAMNSRLNLNISEKYGFAYNLESNYVPYTDTGYFSVYLGTEANYLKKAKSLIFKELNKLKDAKLGQRQLHMAKQQLIGQIALSQENGASQMNALAKSLLTYNRVDTLEHIYKEIESITAEQLLEIANKIFDFDCFSSLSYTNKNIQTMI